MSNSNLVVYTKISPNKTVPRNNKISKITIHHMAGNLSIETCGNVFAPSSRGVSSNYGVGSDGRIGMYCQEKDRSWCSSSRENDNQAVTIEVANSEIGGQWRVSDKALQATINLCYDICKRNGIKKLNYTGNKNGNMTTHNMFTSTTCCGPYLRGKHNEIANEVNRRLNAGETGGSGVNIKVRLIPQSFAVYARLTPANGPHDANLIKIIPTNTLYTVVEDNGKGWIRTEAGWTEKSFFDYQPDTTIYEVTASALNRRSGTSTAYNILSVAQKGTRIRVSEKQGDWIKDVAGGWYCIGLNNTSYVKYIYGKQL